MWSASAPKKKLPNRILRTRNSFTFRLCRRAPSFTRDFCWRRRSPISTAIFLIPMRRARCAWCISAFRPILFPVGKLAHPYRYVAHNGEINTLKGNVHWMHARQSILASRHCFGDDIKKLFPIIAPAGSDSANFDNAVELLFQSGRSLPHVMAMLIPEAWAGNPHMKPEKRAFYEYHAR